MACPILLIIVGFALPKQAVVPFILVLPIHMLVSILITSVLKKFRNILVAAIGVVYVAGISGLCIGLFYTGAIIEIIVIVVLTAFFFLWGILAGIGIRKRDIFFYAFGLVLHALSIFLTGQAPALLSYQSTAVVLGIVYVLAGLPLANRRFLILETREKSSLHRIPGSVSRGNLLVAFCFIIGIILLSFWRTLLDGLLYVASVIAGVIGQIIRWFASLYQTDEGIPEGGGGGSMELPPAEESNPLVSLILDILGILFVAVVLFFIIRYIVKNYKRIYATIYDFFSRIFGRVQRWSTTEQGYVDQQESLLKTDIPKRRSFLRRLLKREPRWKDMKDNASRIRFLYTKFILNHIRRGFQYSPADTPDETVNRIRDMEKQDTTEHEDIRSAYTLVRYGQKEIQDETVKVLKETYLK